MKRHATVILMVIIALLLVAAAVVLWGMRPQARPVAIIPPAPLQNLPNAPIALLGTIMNIDSANHLITVVGQPAANPEPITLQLLITASTTLTEAAPPAYNSSPIAFGELKVGMKVNTTASATDQSGVRAALRVGVIASSSAQ